MDPVALRTVGVPGFALSTPGSSPPRAARSLRGIRHHVTTPTTPSRPPSIGTGKGTGMRGRGANAHHRAAHSRRNCAFWVAAVGAPGVRQGSARGPPEVRQECEPQQPSLALRSSGFVACNRPDLYVAKGRPESGQLSWAHNGQLSWALNGQWSYGRGSLTPWQVRKSLTPDSSTRACSNP